MDIALKISGAWGVVTNNTGRLGFTHNDHLTTLFNRFALIGGVMMTYDQSYFCHDEKLLKTYLFVLASMHLLMVMVEMAIAVVSSMGTIANPEPRKSIHIPLYIQMALFIFEFAWDIVGVLWAFDPSIDCHRSHSVLILCRTILVWNLLTSSLVGFYLIIRIGSNASLNHNNYIQCLLDNFRTVPATMLP